MTATAAVRDPITGRYAAPGPIPCCQTCRYTLADDLAGRTYCPNQRCETYRQPVGTVPGVNPGTLTAADIDPEAET